MERLEDALASGQNTSAQNGESASVLSNNNTNGNAGVSGSGTNERPAVTYSMPGILHYLQHEWNRYELDRQQWEVEKAELTTKISFLQGERRGQENLKNNLIRRIKMLEFALKQERVKYHKLKFGVEPNQSDLKFPINSTTSTNEPNGKFLK